MKKTKLIALILVLVMTLGSMSVFAQYDPVTIRAHGGPPEDQWTVVALYHWVVRGETLRSIAIQYGTSPAEIRVKNPEYFADLANRNTTTGLDIKLEHGVRLFIYHLVRVRHYVQRPETLDVLANGYLTRGSFALITTPALIRNENPRWFANLNALNTTRSSDNPLEESHDIFADYSDFAGVELWWSEPTKVINVDGNDTIYRYAGSPLYISVPVNAVSDPTEPAYIRERYSYIANLGEWQGNPDMLYTNPAKTNPWQIPFANTLPTNNALPTDNNGNPMTGLERAIYGYLQNMRLTRYQIPGVYASEADRVAFADANP